MDTRTHSSLFQKSTPRDDRVVLISSIHNVAQFVSFDDRGLVRHHVLREPPRQNNTEALLTRLFELSISGQVNVRTFAPNASTGASLVGGVETIEAIRSILSRPPAPGAYFIVSELIDVNDGGVSGVCVGDIVEFLHGVSPRFVDRLHSSSFPQLSRSTGERVLRAIYGDHIALSAFDPVERVEFSTHPRPCGLMLKNFIVWDAYEVSSVDQMVPERPTWPNTFSEWIGDKLYGELLSWCIGFRVPKTIAYLHRAIKIEPGPSIERTWVPPEGIEFGEPTGTSGVWVRPCPYVRMPGKFPTFSTWRDPVSLMNQLDPLGSDLRSCLVQEGVSSQFSGAAEIMQDHCLVEGVPGTGASFMVGMQRPYDLPPAVRDSIEGLGRALFERVGACRFEWAWENDREWLLQLNALKNEREPQTRDLRRIAPGYFTYDPEDGLEKLNRIARAALLQGRDVLICKPVGLTSHVCEILQEHRVRFFIKPS